MDYSRLLGLRRIWRKLGLNQILNFIDDQETLALRREYEKSKPETCQIQAAGLSGRFKISHFEEFYRAHKLRADAPFIAAIKKILRPQDHFWDIGASTGTYSVMLSSCVPQGKIFAFEPEPKTFKRLQENFELNQMHQAKAVNLALGETCGSAALRTADQFGAGIHTLVNSSNRPDLHASGSAEVMPGDLYLEQNHLPCPAVIKVDVEGFEEKVFLGLKNTLTRPELRAAFCEVHFSFLDSVGDGEAPRRITELLRHSGLKNLRWIDPQHFLAVRS